MCAGQGGGEIISMAPSGSPHTKHSCLVGGLQLPPLLLCAWGENLALENVTVIGADSREAGVELLPQRAAFLPFLLGVQSVPLSYIHAALRGS